ncbi:MAG TPA: class I SAM-dependent methyltransferase [Microthrixaceae bacterium]|nr:class I SAM-dependent methyltransferase [Microthrixaceae bacterium]
MSDSIPRLRTTRRHPSAGNLDSRPALVREGEPPAPLPPASFPHGAEQSGTGAVRLGPDLDDAALERLIGAAGPIEGRRVLDLGCGAGASSVALARRGARVVAVESSTARLSQARHAADLAEVKVEFHHSDLADLAFLRADSVELALAVYSLAGVQDLGRVFRQLHRVMRSGAALVMSLPHPTALMLEADPDDQSPPYLTRTAWSDTPTAWLAGGDEGVTHLHQIGDVFTTLHRSNFRVDAIVEPRSLPERRSLHSSPLADWVPQTLVIRARKEGI